MYTRPPESITPEEKVAWKAFHQEQIASARARAEKVRTGVWLMEWSGGDGEGGAEGVFGSFSACLKYLNERYPLEDGKPEIDDLTEEEFESYRGRHTFRWRNVSVRMEWT